MLWGINWGPLVYGNFHSCLEECILQIGLTNHQVVEPAKCLGKGTARCLLGKSTDSHVFRRRNHVMKVLDISDRVATHRTATKGLATATADCCIHSGFRRPSKNLKLSADYRAREDEFNGMYLFNDGSELPSALQA